MAKRKRPRPGSRWRVLSWVGKGSDQRGIEPINAGVFDELVVDEWIHLEQMDKRRWWMNVGGVTLWVTVGDDGTAEHVTVYGPGSYAEPVPGCVYDVSWPR